MKAAFLVLMLSVCGPAAADFSMLREGEIILIGEAHDNPGHHTRQAKAVAALSPSAIVFEMLTPEQASVVTDDLRPDRARLAEALGWEASGWPDFAIYYPIFASAPSARIYGAALPRDAARAALASGIPASFGPDAAAYGLDEPLPVAVQEVREEEQRIAHCDALPEEMLAGMVDLQRLRDALLARTALDAMNATGGPVVVITGNGHARRDGGVPEFLARVRPDVRVVTVGQSEAGRVDGDFDVVWPGEPVDRGDPCEVFRKG